MDMNQPVPEWNTILLLTAVVSVIVFAVVQACKQLAADYIEEKKGDDGKKPWWWSAALRTLALLLGAGAGDVLYESLGGIGSGWPWGTAIGAGAGSLASVVVAVVKKRIKALGDQ